MTPHLTSLQKKYLTATIIGITTDRDVQVGPVSCGALLPVFYTKPAAKGQEQERKKN